MKNLVCLIILSLTLVFTVFGQIPKTEKEWFTLGFKQREEYKFSESVISFTECLKINPNSSPCLGLRAKSYWNLSKLDLAEKDFNRSIEVSPNTATLYLNRGEFRQSFLDNQKNELALADFTKVIQLKPDFADAYYFRGQSFVFKKDYNAAESDYKKALEINSNHTSARKALEKLKTERPSVSPTPSPTYRPSNPSPTYRPSTTSPIYQPATVSTPSNSVSNERVVSISQIKDVKPSDSFFRDLQSLIERYGIANLTMNHQFNSSQNLTASDFTVLSNGGLNVLKTIASSSLIPERKFSELFGYGCNLSGVSQNPINSDDSAAALQCLYGLGVLPNSNKNKIITRGEFAVLLNQAIDNGVAKISGWVTKERVRNDFVNRANSLFASNKNKEILDLINQIESKKYDFGKASIQEELALDPLKYQIKAIAQFNLKQYQFSDDTFDTIFTALLYDISSKIDEGVKFKQSNNQSAAEKSFQIAIEKVSLAKSLSDKRRELYQNAGLIKQFKPLQRMNKLAELEKSLKENVKL